MNENRWELADDWYSAVTEVTQNDPILRRVLELTQLSAGTLLSVAYVDARTANDHGALELEPSEVALVLGIQARDVARCRAILADAGFLRAPRHLSAHVAVVRTLRVPPELVPSRSRVASAPSSTHHAHVA